MPYLLGLTYMQKKDYGQAVIQFEKGVALDPANPQFYYQLGAALERNRQLDRAEAIFRRTIELEPKYADAYNYLGYMFAEEGIKLEESVTLVKKALELEPENGAFIDSLGWAYFRLGRIDEALAELLRAVKYSRRDDPTIREHLGDVYSKKGLLRDAIREWERSLELDSSNEAVRKKLEDTRQRISHETPRDSQ